MVEVGMGQKHPIQCQTMFFQFGQWRSQVLLRIHDRGFAVLPIYDEVNEISSCRSRIARAAGRAKLAASGGTEMIRSGARIMNLIHHRKIMTRKQSLRALSNSARRQELDLETIADVDTERPAGVDPALCVGQAFGGFGKRPTDFHAVSTAVSNSGMPLSSVCRIAIRFPCRSNTTSTTVLYSPA